MLSLAKTFSFKRLTHIIGLGFGSYKECTVTVTDLKGDLGDPECTAWLSIHCEDKPVCWGPGDLYTVKEDDRPYESLPEGRFTRLQHDISVGLYELIKEAQAIGGQNEKQ